MAQYTEGQRLKGSDGNIYVVRNGTPVLAPQPISPANPKVPGELLGQTLQNQRTLQEIRQAQAQSNYDTRIKRAQALQEENKASNAAFEAGDALGDPKLTGRARLASVPDSQRPLVQLLLNNQLAQLGAFSLKSPQMQSLLSTAKAIDPTFDPSLMGARYQAIKDFTGEGKGAVAVGAADRLALNLKQLKSISDQMGGPNTGIRPINKAIAGTEQQFEPKLVAQYDALAPEVARQFDRVMKQIGAPTVTGTQEIENAVINRARSQDERNAAFQAMVGALHGALQPLRAQWDSAYGGNTPPPMWLSPEASEFFSQVDPANKSTYRYESHPLPGLHGDSNPLAAPPASGGTPPGSSGGSPPPGTPLTPATGPTKTVFSQSPTDKQVAAMLAAGVPGAKIKKYIADQGANYKDIDSVLAFRALNPQYKGGYDVHTETVVPTTLEERMAASPTSALIHGIADAGTAGLSDEATGAFRTLRDGGSLSDNIANANLEDQVLANANRGATLAGNIIGGASAMLGGGMGARALLASGAKGGAARNFAAWMLNNPVKSAVLADTAYGTAYGAGENNDNRLLGAGVGAITAPVASFAGAGLSNVAGKTLAGVVNPAVQRLRAAGIPLTVGETLGGGFKKAQDALMSVLLGPGSMVARRYAEGRQALNQTAFNQGGQVIGAPINAVGQAGIDALNTAKSNAYSSALDPISLDLGGPQFTDQMQAALDAADKIPGAELPEGYGGVSIRHYVGNQIRPDGTMTGPGFQAAYRGLSKTATKAAPKIEGYDIGQAVGQAKNALTDALQDQNPGAFQGFLNANTANRNLNVLSDAVNAAKNQIGDDGEPLFTPAQLGTAATANAKKYVGNIAAASGNRPFNQLINDAQQVMSSKLPDSGTASRVLATKLASTGLLLGGAGGAGYGVGGSEGATDTGLGTAALLTLGGTKVGQQLLTAALLKRTLADQAAGRALKRNPQIGASILASAGIPLLDSPSL